MKKRITTILLAVVLTLGMALGGGILLTGCSDDWNGNNMCLSTVANHFSNSGWNVDEWNHSFFSPYTGRYIGQITGAENGSDFFVIIRFHDEWTADTYRGFFELDAMFDNNLSWSVRQRGPYVYLGTQRGFDHFFFILANKWECCCWWSGQNFLYINLAEMEAAFIANGYTITISNNFGTVSFWAFNFTNGNELWIIRVVDEWLFDSTVWVGQMTNPEHFETFGNRYVVYGDWDSFSLFCYIKCNGFSPNLPYIAPDRVTIITGSLNPLTMVSQTVQLHSYVQPTNATNTRVNWSSSNTGVAIVSQTGLVTAVGAGQATITASSDANPSLTTTRLVTVNIAGAIVGVTGISTIGGSTATLTNIGQTLQLTASVIPSNATNQAISWQTNNSAVATVNANTGLVTAVNTGTATITATTVDGGFIRTRSVTVNIPSVTGWTRISTAAEFNNIINLPNWQTRNFYLANDINFNGGALTPIGGGETDHLLFGTMANCTLAFRGVFDGRGRRLHNFFSNVGGAYFGGVFRQTRDATLRNIVIHNGTFTSSGMSGILVGRALRTTIENIEIRHETFIQRTWSHPIGWWAYQGLLMGVAYAGTSVTNIFIDAVAHGFNLTYGNLALLATQSQTNSPFTNIFVVNCALAQPVGGIYQVWFNMPVGYGGNIPILTNAHHFAHTNRNNINFSALPTTIWQMNQGLPMLRVLTGTPS